MRNNYPKRSKYRPHYRERGSYNSNNTNTSSEGSIPDARTRSAAQKNLDKYLSMARDASSSGDRVLAENYYQHADHYYRIAHAGLPGSKNPPNPSTPSSEDQESLVIDVEAEPVEDETKTPPEHESSESST